MAPSRISPNGAQFFGAAPPYPISLCVRAGDFVITSALADRVRKTGQDAPPEAGDAAFEREARDTFAAIADALETAGASLADVVDCQVWLRDPADFDLMNVVFVSVFGDASPVRQVFQNAFMFNFRIEVKVVAYAPVGRSA
jgi:enamine deaminase RidA (YjgF/YER057c/UK114 family)